MPVIPQLFEHFKSRDEAGDILFQFSHFCGRFLSYAVNELVHGTVSLMGGVVLLLNEETKKCHEWLLVNYRLSTFFQKDEFFLYIFPFFCPELLEFIFSLRSCIKHLKDTVIRNLSSKISIFLMAVWNHTICSRSIYTSPAQFLLSVRNGSVYCNIFFLN